MKPADDCRLLFVCRGGASVGLGHIMRTAAVAAEARIATGAQTHVVLIGDRTLGNTFFNGGLDWTAVDSDDGVATVAERVKPHVVLFDTVDLDDACVRAIGRNRLKIGLSPVCRFMDRLDLVFSRAALRTNPGRVEVRAGAQYATIGPHCQRVTAADYRHSLSLDPLAVAVSMGGADAANKTLRILEAVREVACPLLIWVLLGEGYLHSYQVLVDCVSADRRHEIILAKTRNSMWRIMAGCSLAILGGGITAYESVYAGIPAILTLEDDRDRFLVAQLVERGTCRYAGAPLEASLGNIVADLVRLNDHRAELWAMHQASRSLLDDRGASRIVEEVLSFCVARVAPRRRAPHSQHAQIVQL